MLKEELAPLLRVLKDLGGRLVFAGEDGEEFVIVRREEFEGAQEKQGRLGLDSQQERQLPAGDQEEAVGSELDEMTDLVNRDIAIAREPITTGEEQEEESVDDIGIDMDHQPAPSFDPAEDADDPAPEPPPVRVRFEPLKGDISPDLQE